MKKITLVLVGLVAVLASTSLAANFNDYQPNPQQASDNLREAELESWWRRRGLTEVEDAMAVDRQLAQARQLQDSQMSVPEASNYDLVAEPYGCTCIGIGGCIPFFGCSCIGWSDCRRSLRRVHQTRQTSKLLENEPDIIVLGSEAELKLYSDPNDRLFLFNAKVARAELITRPLDPATPAQVSDALGGLQHAVVATLTDGRRFLLVKGNRKGQGSQTIVILADHMTDDWTKVTTKVVSQSTLLDFIKAGGFTFDPLNDNGKLAAARMMALP
jgi:hypothetical protein